MYEELLYDAIKYLKDNNIDRYELQEFISLLNEAYALLFNYFEHDNIIDLFTNTFNECEYFEFKHKGYLSKNRLFNHYGILVKYDYERNFINKSLKSINTSTISIVKFPINKLINTKNTEKWMKLKKTM